MLPLKNFTANSLSCICGINQSSGKHYTFVTCISSVAIANVDLFHYKLPCYEFNIPSCEKKKPNTTVWAQRSGNGSGKVPACIQTFWR